VARNARGVLRPTAPTSTEGEWQARRRRSHRCGGGEPSVGTGPAARLQVNDAPHRARRTWACRPAGGRRDGHLRVARVPDTARRRFPGGDRSAAARSVLGLDPWVRATVVLDPVRDCVPADVAVRDRGVPQGAWPALPRAPALSPTGAATNAITCAWGNPLRDPNGSGAGAVVAHGPAAWSLYRDPDSRRCRDRQDVRLHVSVRRSALAVAEPGWVTQGGRPRDGSEG
jgi:hypothetical protein